MQIAIEGCAVERNHDDFAAVGVVAFFIGFGDVDGGEGEGFDVAVFDVDAGAFKEGPVVDGAVGVVDEVGGGVVGEAAVGPVVAVASAAAGRGVFVGVGVAAGAADLQDAIEAPSAMTTTISNQGQTFLIVR